MTDPFIVRLDELKAKRTLSDADLARLVGFSTRQHLAKIRKGIRNVPLEVKLLTLDLLGFPLDREQVFALLPEKYGTLAASGKQLLSGDR